MKVVLAGASGSGKTTLAKALAEHFGWEFKENSAGMIISPEDKKQLMVGYGYDGGWGQKRVINESHMGSFGIQFQEAILNARKVLIDQSGDRVYDRSALDPIVFWLNQVVHNTSQWMTQNFIYRCSMAMQGIDLILRIPLQNPDKQIEDNGSRVPNWYFQKKIDGMFDTAIEIAFQMIQEAQDFMSIPKTIIVARCPTWNWEDRLAWAIEEVEKLRIR